MITLSISFLALMPVGGLSVYHAYLAGCNRTTNEDVNDVYKRIENPYDAGGTANCCNTFFPRLRKSRLLVGGSAELPPSLKGGDMASQIGVPTDGDSTEV